MSLSPTDKRIELLDILRGIAIFGMATACTLPARILVDYAAFGLGLFGTVFPAAGLLIVLALLPAQLIASQWWLSRFNFGPFEWLWRSWTYGRFPEAMLT